MADVAANPVAHADSTDGKEPEVVTARPMSEPSVPALQAAVPVRMAAFEPTEFYALLKLVVGDPSLSPTDKQKLIDELRKTTPTSDRWTFRASPAARRAGGRAPVTASPWPRTARRRTAARP